MTRDDAERLLAWSREARWTFPSSAGRPVHPGADGWVREALPQREAFVEAARVFVDAGDDGAAAELAANTWRLWVAAGDADGGRRFLATALDNAEAKPSRA